MKMYRQPMALAAAEESFAPGADVTAIESACEAQRDRRDDRKAREDEDQLHAVDPRAS